MHHTSRQHRGRRALFIIVGVALLFWCAGFGCGEVTVSFPGCETCPERCINLDSGKGKCVACLKDADCRTDPGSTKRCSADNRCVCGSDGDCSQRQVCAGNKGCVECQSDGDCPNADRPTCVVNECRPCRPNESRACTIEGAEVCQKGTQTCKNSGSWGECEGALICQKGETCQAGTCVTACSSPPACQEGDTKCLDASEAFVTCTKDAKGCPVWETKGTICQGTDVCQTGQCVPFTCPQAPCKVGETRCDDKGDQQTCAKDAKGCPNWGPSASCPKAQPTCDDTSGRCVFCKPKSQQECFSGDPTTKGIGACKAGTQTCKDDGSGFEACKGEVTPGKELCNGQDDDCDGVIDAFQQSCYTGPKGTAGQGDCTSGTQFCLQGKWEACQGEQLPAATDTCGNNKDDDCNGFIDETCGWATGIRGTSHIAVDVDSKGNTYVTGSFTGSIKVGTFTLQAKGSDDIYLLSYAPGGSVRWALSAGGSGEDKGLEVATQGTQVCITGSFSKQATFGNKSITAKGTFDAFVACYDDTGAFQWVQHTTGSQSARGYGITLDRTGKAYVTGEFAGAAVFGSQTLSSQGNQDIFIAQASTQGWGWSQGFGGTDNDSGRSITLSQNTDLVMTGHYRQSLKAGSSSLTSQGLSEALVLKLDLTGKISWALSSSGKGANFGNRVAVDGSGNIFLVGSFGDLFKLGIHTASSHSSFPTSPNGFVSMIDGTGKVRWMSAANAGASFARGVGLGPNGSIYIAGSFTKTNTFNGQTVTSKGSYDVFVAQADASGKFKWVTTAGSNFSDRGLDLAVAPSGLVMVGGLLGAAATFDKVTLPDAGQFLWGVSP